MDAYPPRGFFGVEECFVQNVSEQDVHARLSSDFGWLFHDALNI
jgi:hypothetical protein